MGARETALASFASATCRRDALGEGEGFGVLEGKLCKYRVVAFPGASGPLVSSSTPLCPSLQVVVLKCQVVCTGPPGDPPSLSVLSTTSCAIELWMFFVCRRNYWLLVCYLTCLCVFDAVQSTAPNSIFSSTSHPPFIPSRPLPSFLVCRRQRSQRRRSWRCSRGRTWFS